MEAEIYCPVCSSYYYWDFKEGGPTCEYCTWPPPKKGPLIYLGAALGPYCTACRKIHSKMQCNATSEAKKIVVKGAIIRIDDRIIKVTAVGVERFGYAFFSKVRKEWVEASMTFAELERHMAEDAVTPLYKTGEGD